MSGLLALLDDVAAIAKVASASIDDVVGQAVKASGKAAGAVIDDAAVSPKYVHGFAANRELPIVWRIAKGSLFNKIVILVPIALLLSAFAPQVIYPLLMLGGAYLCYEGAEKLWHAVHPHKHPQQDQVEQKKLHGAHLEQAKVKGAVKTDFILSAEIMTIVLTSLSDGLSFWMQFAALIVAAIIITVAVYGAVGLIVKADDIGLAMVNRGRFALTRRIGEGIVRAMPYFMNLLIVVGTAAMIWVGGSILVHGLHELGWHAPQEWIEHLAEAAAASFGGAVGWIVTAFCDGVIGLAVGAALIPVVAAIAPMFGKSAEQH